MNELLEMTATELVGRMTAGELSSRELTQAHLEQIEAVNPALNAIVTLDPERALQAARDADEALPATGPLGPLHGLPMTHKDSHMVAGMRSTQGSPIFAEHVPDADDRLIARLRRAGVVATGKSNIPEFAAGSHTFNEVFGTTVNPYDTGVSAGGSSGGVAAAIASRIQPLGDGSDMGGSLRIPASFCNVYGFRPSYGVIPTFPPQNPQAWLARGGPMARTVADLELFMRAVSGPVPELPSVRALDAEEFGARPAESLSGVRIAVTKDFGQGVPVDPEMLAAVDRAAETLAGLGASVEEATIDFSGADEVFHVTRAFDFATTLGPLVEQHRDRIKPEVIWNVEEGLRLDAARLIRANELYAALQEAVRDFFSGYDLLLAPGSQVLPFDASLRYPAEVAGVPCETYLDWMRAACLLSATGLPVLAMPAGFSASGLPTGVQLAGPHGSDPALLRWAHRYDEATGWPSEKPGILKS